MSYPFPQNRIQQERAMWESGGENIGNLLAAILRMIQQNQMKSEASDQFGSAVSGATRTSYEPTYANAQQENQFQDVLNRGTIEAQPRDPGAPIIGSQLGAPIAASLGQVVAQRGPQGQANVATNPYARTDSLDNNALMRSLAQMLGQTQNPMLKEQIGSYFAGQKAVQGLQPEYGFENTPAGLYRTDKRSGTASPIAGTQPPMVKKSFKTDNVTVDEDGKPMQYRIVTDELGNEVRREKIGPSYQKPEKTEKPNLIEGFSQITDPKVKADLFNKTYGTKLTPDAFFKDEDKPTQTTKTMMEAAPKVKNLVNRIVPTLQALSRDLGPISGRWNDFMTGKIGTENEEYNKLRVNVGLLTTLLMRMHVGARGSNAIMQKFDNLIGLGYQDPRNLLAAIGEIGVYADDVAAGAKSGGKSGGSFWDK